MNELIVVLLMFFIVTTGIFLACTIHYRRRFDEMGTDRVIFRNLYIRLRDHGMEHVVKHLNVHYMIKYRDEIAKVDEAQRVLHENKG